MALSWISLIPPLVTLTLAFISKRVLLSLSCGIITAAYIVGDGDVLTAITLITERTWTTTQLGNLISFQGFCQSSDLCTFLFLLLVALIIVMVNHSGGIYAYTSHIRRMVHSSRGVENAAIGLSFLLFIDDFFSSITVGSVMRPLTHTYKIPAIKLAFLVDSLAAPLCILAPISSFMAAIVVQLRNAGVTETITKTTTIACDPYVMYLQTIPFIFYSLIIIPVVIFVVNKPISFGLIGKAEVEHRAAPDKHIEAVPNAALIDLVFPLVMLIGAVFTSLLYSGNWVVFGGVNGIGQAFRSADSPFALFMGSVIATVVTIIFYLARKVMKLSSLPRYCWEGIDMMGPAILILILAWTLGGFVKNDLKTGEYLASLLIGNVPLFLFPAILFVVTGTVAFAIGSTWGATALMLPIAIPMILRLAGVDAPATLDQIPLLLPSIGAILSGAVGGDHISPLAATTVMSATSSGCNEMDHVNSQLQYAFSAGIAALIAFISAGFCWIENPLYNGLFHIVLGGAIAWSMLLFCNSWCNKK